MKKVLLNSAIVFFSILLSVLLAESIVRVFKLAYVIENNSDMFFEPFDGFNYFGKKNFKGVWSTPEFRINIEHNSKGFRDDEYNIDKREEAKRVVVLGDSFTWGWGIDEEDVYSKKLKNRLKNNTEVINMGVPGYGIKEEYAVFEKYCIELKPDLVIVAFFYDDFAHSQLLSANIRKDKIDINNTGFKDHSFNVKKKILYCNQYYGSFNGMLALLDKTCFFAIQGSNPLKAGSIVFGMRDFLRSHSALYNFTVSKFKTAGKLQGLRDKFIERGLMKALPTVSVAAETLKSKDKWQYTKDILLKMKALADENNIELTVVIIPEKPQVYERFWPAITTQYNITPKDLEAPNNYISSVCRNNDINVLDLLSGFRDHAKTGDALYFDYDPHWNVRGHDLASSLIYEYLIKSNILNP